MEDIAIIAVLIGGLVGIIQHNGGIEWLLNFVRSKVTTKRGVIWFRFSERDIAANNTFHYYVRSISQKYCR